MHRQTAARYKHMEFDTRTDTDIDIDIDTDTDTDTDTHPTLTFLCVARHPILPQSEPAPAVAAVAVWCGGADVAATSITLRATYTKQVGSWRHALTGGQTQGTRACTQQSRLVVRCEECTHVMELRIYFLHSPVHSTRCTRVSDLHM